MRLSFLVALAVITTGHPVLAEWDNQRIDEAKKQFLEVSQKTIDTLYLCRNADMTKIGTVVLQAKRASLAEFGSVDERNFDMDLYEEMTETSVQKIGDDEISDTSECRSKLKDLTSKLKNMNDYIWSLLY